MPLSVGILGEKSANKSKSTENSTKTMCMESCSALQVLTALCCSRFPSDLNLVKYAQESGELGEDEL